MLSSLVNAAPEWQAGSLEWRSRELMAACPLEGLVGRPSSLKKAAPLVDLWFAQCHAGFLKPTQDRAFHQNERGLQWFGHRDVSENDGFPLFVEPQSQFSEVPG
jgi:hypothetical protein